MSRPSLRMRLRLTGVAASTVFLVMVASDLLMLTSLDFSEPYRFWIDAPPLPQAQVTLGYFLGELTIPFYCIGAWHMSLAIQPPVRWASLLVILATAYSTALFTVWHASFALTRSILRAELGARATVGDPGPEASMAFSTYAEPLFRVGLSVVGLAFVVLIGLIGVGRTLYPRWASVALPTVFIAVAFLLRPLVPLWGSVVLGAAGWNAGCLAMFGLSTALLWNRGTESSA